MKLISDCLELLPLNQKMAFNLKEIEEEMTEEICNILSVSATNLGVLLFRARNQLRECIEKKT
jgi:DNA-directed RNA polymerase specialized sigma24 family protein